MLAFLLAPFYLLFNLYLFRRIMGWVRAWFPWFRKRKHWAVPAALYAFFALSFVLAFPLPAGRLKRALMLIGNYWLGVLLYLLLAVLLADGLRLLLVHGLKLRSLRSARMHRIAGCLCAAAILVTSVGGVINARIVRVTPYEITVNKSAGSMESMKVVLLADLHLGYNVGLAQMERMVARVNEQDADRAMKALNQFLRPEFINRVDEIICFNHLSKENFAGIARIMLEELRKSLSDKGYTFHYDDALVDYLVKKSYSAAYGARNLRRCIRKDVEDPMAARIIESYETPITQIKATAEDGAVKLYTL